MPLGERGRDLDAERFSFSSASFSVCYVFERDFNGVDYYVDYAGCTELDTMIDDGIITF